MSFSFRLALLITACTLACGPAAAHDARDTTASLLEARAQFPKDRFGIMIHWGVYAALGGGEWAMEDRKMTTAEYEKIASSWSPAEFRAEEWVSLVKSAGARYLTFTCKHHDGFAMWDSVASDWNIVKRTPFARDVVQEVAEQCRRKGLKLYLYYSHLDWHHPDYYPRGKSGKHSGRPERGDWNAYLGFVDSQLRELLTDYGQVHGVWLDGWWDRPDANWQFDRTYQLIHSLQPTALIGNNQRSLRSSDDEQKATHGLPQPATARYGVVAVLKQLPSETVDTMTGSWGYDEQKAEPKPPREVLRELLKAAGRDSNYLLNIAPDADGRISQPVAQTLRTLGMWLAKHGQAVYGTREGPVPPQSWGATTRRGRKVYIHVVDSLTTTIALQIPKLRVQSARYLQDEMDVPFRVEESTLTLPLRREAPGELTRVVVLETSEL